MYSHANSLSVPSYIQDLRRPETTNASDYWHISSESWNEAIASAQDPATRKAALNTLRKFDAAGRMVETSEGKTAAVACSWCDRPGALRVECRVFVSGKEQGCAYCRRHGKGGCFAGDPSKAPGPTVEERLTAVEKQLGSVTGELRKLSSRLEDVVGWLSMLDGDILSYEETNGVVGGRPRI